MRLPSEDQRGVSSGPWALVMIFTLRSLTVATAICVCSVASVVTNATRVLACELLCAAQGLEFLRPLRPGRGVAAAHEHLRAHVRPLGRDRTLHRDLEAVERLIRTGSLVAAVEAVGGELE